MATKNIPQPTPQTVEKACEKWESDDVCKGLEDFLDGLFVKYKNKDPGEVLQKIRALNLIYATRLGSEKKMAKIAQHIAGLDIDEKLRNGNFSIVNEIARTGIRNFYSFASKYCAFHNPTKYALYDSQADATLWHFQKRDKFSNFKRSELKTYKNYMRVIGEFQKYYGLEKFTLRQIDHYLWFTGAKI